MSTENISNEPTTKAEVINAVANILIRLGKSDINDVRKAIYHASLTFEKWVADRPEKEKNNQ